MKIRFSDYELDLERFTLRRAGAPVHVEPQVFDLLACLAGRPGEIVSKDDLIAVVWKGLAVSDATVNARISAARKAVGDDGKSQLVIRTIHRRGFQFCAEVDAAGGSAEPDKRGMNGDTRPGVDYCASADGTAIAWSAHGDGPVLVRISHWLSHLDLDWGSTIWRPLIDRLANGRQLVRYDQRGTGLSDRAAPFKGIEVCVDDLGAVIDACGANRVHLFAASQASPVAIAYAAQKPERVGKLVIYGGYAVGRAIRADEPDAVDEPTMLSILRAGWGKPDSPFFKAFETLYAPDATPEQLDELIEMQLATIGPERVTELRRAIDRFDVSHLLAKVQAQTLVLHAEGDAIQPFSQGQKIAAGIPNANLHRLLSRNHMPLPHEESWAEMMRQIDFFLAD